VLLVEQVRIRTSHPLHDDKVPLLKVVHATRAQLGIVAPPASPPKHIEHETEGWVETDVKDFCYLKE